jgi:hypothetical protein
MNRETKIEVRKVMSKPLGENVLLHCIEEMGIRTVLDTNMAKRNVLLAVGNTG